MSLQLEKNCPTSITTKSGTFTFHTEQVPSCKAKKICASLGRILAPITNVEDRDAIQNITNQRCGMFRNRGINLYHVGLDNIVCDNEVDRVFTNGVEYNKTLHDKLYYFYPRDGSNCLASLWATGQPVGSGNVFVIGMPDTCEDYKKPYICLDQAKDDNSTEVAVNLKRSRRSEITLSENDSTNQRSLFLAWQLFFVCFLAIVCCFLFVAVRKLKVKIKNLNKKVSILTTENNSLKSSQNRQE